MTASLPEIVALATVIVFVPRIPPPAAEPVAPASSCATLPAMVESVTDVVAVEVGGTPIPPPPKTAPCLRP